MIIHLQLCSITHLHCELPSICLIAEDKTSLEKLGKKWLPGGIRLKGKTAREGGMFGVGGWKREGRKEETWKMQKSQRSRKKKKIKARKYESSVAWWRRSGLIDGRGEDLCPALQVNFWVTVDHLHHLCGLSFTFCEIGPVVLTLLWDARMGKASWELL